MGSAAAHSKAKILLLLLRLLGFEFGPDLELWITVSFPVVLFVCFVALRPKSTAMVIAGRSVHLTTLFPGQA